MLDDEYNACSSALCNFLHSPVILSLSAPNIFLSTLVSHIINSAPLSHWDTKFHNQAMNTTDNIIIVTTCLVQWLARLTAIQEDLGSIPGYTLEIFLEV